MEINRWLLLGDAAWAGWSSAGPTMNIGSWIILGGLAGWLAGLLMRTHHGCLLNIVVGIIGAFLGGLLFSHLAGTGFAGFNLWGFVVATVGAVLFLFALKLMRGKKD